MTLLSHKVLKIRRDTRYNLIALQGGQKNGQPMWPKFDQIYWHHVIE